jgi:hypothetical protein
MVTGQDVDLRRMPNGAVARGFDVEPVVEDEGSTKRRADRDQHPDHDREHDESRRVPFSRDRTRTVRACRLLGAGPETRPLTADDETPRW